MTVDRGPAAGVRALARTALSVTVVLAGGLLGGALAEPRPVLAETRAAAPAETAPAETAPDETAPARRAQTAVALELVLAVDASSSVDQQEYALQMQGLAGAFREPDVLAALRSVGSVAVTLMQWSSTSRQSFVVPWTLLRADADAHEFARQVELAPRQVRSGGTGIAAALDAGLMALQANAYAGARRVIDLSGDGRANMGDRPSRARDRAAAAGVTINGLAILNEEPALDRYYADYVIAGPRAFLMTAADYATFAEAIRRKLVREITGAQMVEAPSSPPAGAAAAPWAPPPPNAESHDRAGVRAP